MKNNMSVRKVFLSMTQNSDALEEKIGKKHDGIAKTKQH